VDAVRCSGSPRGGQAEVQWLSGAGSGMAGELEVLTAPPVCTSSGWVTHAEPAVTGRDKWTSEQPQAARMSKGRGCREAGRAVPPGPAGLLPSVLVAPAGLLLPPLPVSSRRACWSGPPAPSCARLPLPSILGRRPVPALAPLAPPLRLGDPCPTVGTHGKWRETLS
jgi:hypothetical protein